jgi:hypothetical protein
MQHLLQDLRVEVAVLGPDLLDSRQLRRLHGEGHADAAVLPRGFALVQASVVEFAAAPQDALQRPFLLGRWQQLVLEGLAHALLVHMHLFCYSA